MDRVGKRLDESAFSNQLNVLVSKREAGNAGYLRLLADEIASFGLFDDLDAKLSAVGGTTKELLEQILFRLEEEMGRDLVDRTVALLCVAPYGLTEPQLKMAFR